MGIRVWVWLHPVSLYSFVPCAYYVCVFVYACVWMGWGGKYAVSERCFIASSSRSMPGKNNMVILHMDSLKVQRSLFMEDKCKEYMSLEDYRTILRMLKTTYFQYELGTRVSVYCSHTSVCCVSHADFRGFLAGTYCRANVRFKTTVCRKRMSASSKPSASFRSFPTRLNCTVTPMKTQTRSLYVSFSGYGMMDFALGVHRLGDTHCVCALLAKPITHLGDGIFCKPCT